MMICPAGVSEFDVVGMNQSSDLVVWEHGVTVWAAYAGEEMEMASAAAGCEANSGNDFSRVVGEKSDMLAFQRLQSHILWLQLQLKS